MSKTDPKPPSGLPAAAKKFWREVTTNFELEDHHLKLLEQAAWCLARIDAAKELINKDGLTVANRHGEQRPHPAIEIELSNKRTFKMLLRELSLDLAPEDEGYGRPIRQQYGPQTKG